MFAYSLIWMNRNVQPSRKVVSMPAFRPKRLPFLIDVCAQCIVIEEDTRIAVLTPATSTGRRRAGRRPRIALSDADEEVGGEEGAEDHHLGDDEKQHPSSCGSTRELTLAAGGPWWSWSPWAAVCAMLAASIGDTSAWRPVGRSSPCSDRASRARRPRPRSRRAADRRRRARPAPRSCAARARSGSSASSPSAGRAAWR